MTKIRRKIRDQYTLYFVDANIKIIKEIKANQIQQNINKCLYHEQKGFQEKKSDLISEKKSIKIPHVNKIIMSGDIGKRHLTNY